MSPAARWPRLANFYGIEPDHVVAVHDEIDIPFNTVKLKSGGGEGGHNGLTGHVQGAGHQGLPAGPGGGGPAARAGWTQQIMSCATSARRSARNCRSCSDEAADAVEMLVRDGLTAAQQKFHPAKSDAVAKKT